MEESRIEDEHSSLVEAVPSVTIKSPSPTNNSTEDQRSLTQIQNNNDINKALSWSLPRDGIALHLEKATYGYRKKSAPILNQLDLKAPTGCIYGLLGPSGCGKTTLLQCIVGKRRLQSGTVKVLGGPAGVPGPKVGYMPQELALYHEFTLSETLQYFGHIYGLSSACIKERTAFLLKFLDLTEYSQRLVRQMSGGQQRRVSLGAALLHQPPLLILDEPTVGVDPLLRQCIWNHLLKISRGPQVCTIVITTHYIEEARQADVVGMMRSGRLLAEDAPSNLLERYGETSLESVFLKLCLADDDDVDEASTPHVIATSSDHDRSIKSAPESSSYDQGWCSFHRLRALLVKNLVRMWRNLGFLIFQFLIPTVQVALFCLAIGRDPSGLTMAVINNDANMTDSCRYFTDGCILGNKDDFMGGYDGHHGHLNNLSCRFLSFVQEDFVRPVYYESVDQALESIRQGHHWGALEFRTNYSQALYDRMFGMVELRPPTNETLEDSEIHVHLDMTNQQIGYTIQLRLSQAYQEFSRGLLSACDLPAELASMPLAFEEPVYGSNQPTFTEFMAPGVILSITYFMAVGLTALSFILERKEGLLDRSWVAGVTATEVMLAHVIAQFIVLIMQVALVLIFMIYVFKVPSHGPMIWVIGLTLLQGLCGMAFGLVVSSLCDNEQDAIQVALGSFYPNLLLSGIIWPLEGMLPELRYFSYILPQTYACQAMRGMLSRGWGLSWPDVYTGYLVTFAWTVIQLILSSIILKWRR